MPKRLSRYFAIGTELWPQRRSWRRDEEAIAGSRFLIVALLARTAKSHWIDEEIACFKRLHREDRVLAAIIDGEPFAAMSLAARGRNASRPLCALLRRPRRPTRSAPNHAADLREEETAQMGLLKIAAG